MAKFTYTGNPATVPLDEVRFLAQDTDSADPLLLDSEVNYLLTKEGSALRAAARAAEIIMAKFARLCDETVGQVRVNFSQRYDHYKDLVKELRNRANISDADWYAGGITESDKDVNRFDDDRVEPFFSRQKDDFVRDTQQRRGREKDLV